VKAQVRASITARTIGKVDEIHNVNLATTAGEDLSDHLKYFTEHLPATFVFAGINVEPGGLFTGVRGQQIAARCVMARIGKSPTATSGAPWSPPWNKLSGCTATSPGP
jgi:hypothetical protein